MIQPTTPFSVSLFTSDDPIGKGFKLDDLDGLIKIPGGQITAGTVETVVLDSMNAFASMLVGLGANNALSYGLCGSEKAYISTKKKVEALTKQKGRAPERNGLPVIPRSNSIFSFAESPSIMMVDYDRPKDGRLPLAPEELYRSLCEVCPAIKNAPAIITHSVSSFIHNNGTQLLGQGGLRLYILVKNGADLPRAGRALFKKTVLAGHGYAEITKSGRILVKSILDEMVYQPERLDFCGSAYLEPPLKQKRPKPTVFNPGAPPLDTALAIPELDLQEQSDLDAAIKSIKAQAHAQAEEVRERWAEQRARDQLIKEGTDSEKSPERFSTLRNIYRQASLHGTLLGDFVVETQDGRFLTVGELLDDRDKYHKLKIADPLEPEYGGGDKRIATVYLRSVGRPKIHSFAHGGVDYYLHRALQTIQHKPGELIGEVERVLELFRLDGGIFERNGGLVRVSADGEIHDLNTAGILYEMNRVAHWHKYDARSKSLVPCDAPKNVAEAITIRAGHWNLPRLKVVITAPTYHAESQRVIDVDGLDAETGLLFVPKDLTGWRGVPEFPTQKQFAEAVRKLWFPFERFDFCGPVSRGVALASILAAIIRPGLETAPGHLFTAPTPASGKTLFASCCGVLSGEENVGMMPAPTGSGREEEMRKRLLALGRQGKAVAVIDNVSDDLESDSLCAWLTSPIFSDRVLGASESIGVPTNCLLIVTGNNVVLRGDLCRRVLTCRLDPGVETPWRRAFDLNPVAYCREHRMEMVSAALTILRYVERAEHPAKDRTASFERWSDTVRKAVMIVGAEKVLDVVDPTLAFDESFVKDATRAKLLELLESWRGVWGDKPATVAESVKTEMADGLLAEDRTRLNAAMREIAGERGAINTRKLGGFIASHEGRIAGGLRFVRGKVDHKVLTWTVEKSGGLGEFGGSFGLETLEVSDDSYYIGTENNPRNPSKPPEGEKGSIYDF